MPVGIRHTEIFPWRLCGLFWFCVAFFSVPFLMFLEHHPVFLLHDETAQSPFPLARQQPRILAHPLRAASSSSPPRRPGGHKIAPRRRCTLPLLLLCAAASHHLLVQQHTRFSLVSHDVLNVQSHSASAHVGARMCTCVGSNGRIEPCPCTHTRKRRRHVMLQQQRTQWTRRPRIVPELRCFVRVACG
jgi:hypothetical protein